MIRIFKIAFLLILCGGINILYAQNEIGTLDFKKIKQKKVRQYIRAQQNKDIVSFSDLETSVSAKDELTDFLNFKKEYLVKEESDFVWDNYKYSSQTDVWDLNKISFGFLFNRNTELVIYDNEDFYGFEKGQVYCLNLRILNGFYNLPVAFEIINVDHENMIIEFSYMKGGKAEGKQTIQLEETEAGFTKIIHKSFVKSNSKIRDKYLYPYFHNKLINEFHGNMKKIITRQAKSSTMTLTEAK